MTTGNGIKLTGDQVIAMYPASVVRGTDAHWPAVAMQWIQQADTEIVRLTKALAQQEPLSDEPQPVPLSQWQKVIATLQLYADPSFYHGIAIMADRPTGGFDEDVSMTEEYDYPKPGKLARATLAAVGEPEVIACHDLDALKAIEAAAEGAQREPLTDAQIVALAEAAWATTTNDENGDWCIAFYHAIKAERNKT